MTILPSPPAATRGTMPGADAAMIRFVGRRIRLRRLELGLGLEALAERAKLPVSELIMQEEGAARLPAEALLALARALNVPLLHFYATDSAMPPMQRGLAEPSEVLEIFERISDPRLRSLAVERLRVLARAG